MAFLVSDNLLSGKHLKIMNLGDGQGTSGGVTDVLRDTDDDAVDPHLERIKNQAGDEESDEEVWLHFIGLLLDADLLILLLSSSIYLFSFSLHVRMKILLWIRMMVDLLLMILMRMNQMLVKVGVKKR